MGTAPSHTAAPDAPSPARRIAAILVPAALLILAGWTAWPGRVRAPEAAPGNSASPAPPFQLPAPPDSRRVSARADKGRMEFRFISQDAPESVAAFYRRQMTPLGWREVAFQFPGEGPVGDLLAFSRRSAVCMISLSRLTVGQGTTVTIVVLEKGGPRSRAPYERTPDAAPPAS